MIIRRTIQIEAVARFKSRSQRERWERSVRRAHYHACVGSERDDSFYASCRREWWSAELHIDFCAVRGAVVLPPSLAPALSLGVAFSPHACGLLLFFFFFWLSHKSGINVSCSVSWSSGRLTFSRPTQRTLMMPIVDLLLCDTFHSADIT